MKSFLSLIASDMLEHFSGDMRDVTVVFPGKRAGMFLSRELAMLNDKPVWAPHYLTMSDLFLSLTSLQTADTLECICHLHSVMQEVLGSDYTETIDEFWSWGEVLMADFDDIDKHLADARAIFTNIADQERLKNLDYLDDNQRATLRRFFGRFSLENSTRLQEKFLHTWSHMHDIYTRLHERLLAEGKLWEGALFRHVVEKMQADESLVGKLLEGRRAIVFAGFNVLGSAEHTMMRLIQREGKARFYWDYDISYMNGGKTGEESEAGHFMKQNLHDFPPAIGSEEAFDNLSQLKDVTFIACTTDNAAARYAGTWSATHNTPASQDRQPSPAGEGNKGCSIVLCNESLMQPVLHAIPETVAEINVTMGFPIADTPVYGIIMALLKLQMEGYDATRERFRYPFEQTLRRQPLFEYLREEDVFHHHGDNPDSLLAYLLRLLRQVALHYARTEEPDILEQLYSEAVFRTDRILCQLRSWLSTLNPQLSTHTLRRLLRQMLMSTSIPFHSEPDRGLQMMGMLETRCLDFSHILLLSAEEGNLPRGAYATSFIPESLREAFGMTTQKHRIAVYAYYFYRLISRCRHLTCVYNESTSDGQQHEMSRFLRQLLAERDIPIRTLWLRSEPQPRPSQPLAVEKTADVMNHLRRRYDQSLADGEHIMLSPSAIGTYTTCPMQFYLNNVLRIRKEDDTQEGISADIIGNIFHDTAELFYEWLMAHYETDTITADMLHHPDELRQMLHAAFDVNWFHPVQDFDRLPEIKRRFQQWSAKGRPSIINEYKGTTLIAHDVLLRYLQGLVRYDARHTPFRIIGAEKQRTATFAVGNIMLKVGGRLDRIDIMNGRLRIVDYKTGSHESPRYRMQIFLYALAEMEKREKRGEDMLPIQPVLFFPIKASAEDYEPSLVINGNIVDDFAAQHASSFREELQEILSDIFNPDKPFTCTTDTQACTYCKLGLICGKQQS